jgi:hypothetical protein
MKAKPMTRNKSSNGKKIKTKTTLKVKGWKQNELATILEGRLKGGQLKKIYTCY